MAVVAIVCHLAATAVAQYLWFRTSDVFAETMYLARNSQELERKIGGPMVAGWPFIYRDVYRGVGQVNAWLPVRGPRGTATVRVRAKNRGGSWEYQLLSATVAADASLVDLTPRPWHPQQLVVRGAGRLYFVGIGDGLTLDVPALAHHYEQLYGVDITVLPPLSYAPRRQRAREMIRVLKAGYPDLVASPRAILIAVTDIDMEWYSWREDWRFAVVSTDGLSADRFHKQLSKCIGLLWFELPLSADSRSLLYDDVSGTIDLDLQSDQF